jgi:hypothetical protein
MKLVHKLLTFNEDHGDEFNVPALQCFTIEEFETWKKLPTGTLNPEFEEKHKIWKEGKAAKQASHDRIRELGLSNTRPDDVPKEHKEEYNKLRLVPYVSPWSAPKRVISDMHANLGNYSDGWDDQFTDYYLHEELIEAGLVKVTDVTEEFSTLFHKAKLSSLSLCNVFEMYKM